MNACSLKLHIHAGSHTTADSLSLQTHAGSLRLLAYVGSEVACLFWLSENTQFLVSEATNAWWLSRFALSGCTHILIL